MSKKFGIFLLVFVCMLPTFGFLQLSHINAKADDSDPNAIEITHFGELASIGRLASYPSDGHYILKNNITLPYVGSQPQNPNLQQQMLINVIPDYYQQSIGVVSKNRGWLAIPDFSGVFDGNGFTISGLAGDRVSSAVSGEISTESAIQAVHGLFGIVSGTIKNLTVSIGPTGSYQSNLSLLGYGHTDAAITKGMFDEWYAFNNGGSAISSGGVGTIAGVLNGGTIENCHALSAGGASNPRAIMARGENIGGVVGFSFRGTIRNSSSSVRMAGCEENGTFTITRGSYMGGIVGRAQGGLIENCYTTAEFRGGDWNGGGLASSLVWEAVTIRNSYAAGTILGGNRAAAGFVFLIDSADHVIENCFSATEYSGTNEFDGFAFQREGGQLDMVFSTASAALAVSVDRAKLNTAFTVQNILNKDSTIFEVDTSVGATLPKINRHPQPLDKVEVSIISGTLQAISDSQTLEGEQSVLEADDSFAFLNRPIKLVAGTYRLKVLGLGESKYYLITVSAADVLSGTALKLIRVNFYSHNNELMGAQFFKQDAALSFEPPTTDMQFSGWFTDQFAGEQVTTASMSLLTNDNIIEVWAQFAINGIYGTAPSGAQILFSAISLTGNQTFEDKTLIAVDGEFYLPQLPEGEYRLTAQQNGFISLSKTITLGKQKQNAGDFTLEPVVLKGIGAQQARVTIFDRAGKQYLAQSLGTIGTFSLSNVLDGDYIIRLEKDGFKPRTIEITVNRQSIDLNEQLQEAGELALVAVKISGTAKNGSLVQLLSNGNVVAEVEVGEDQAYEFSATENWAIYNTTYDLRAILQPFVTEYTTITVSDNADFVFNFTLRDTVTISGRTSQRTTVYLYQGTQLIATTTTDSYGDYTFEQVHNGDYIVVLERRNYRSQSIEVSVNGASKELEQMLLQREEPNNVFFGFLIQGILVFIALAVLWQLMIRKKKSIDD